MIMDTCVWCGKVVYLEKETTQCFCSEQCENEHFEEESWEATYEK